MRTPGPRGQIPLPTHWMRRVVRVSVAAALLLPAAAGAGIPIAALASSIGTPACGGNSSTPVRIVLGPGQTAAYSNCAISGNSITDANGGGVNNAGTLTLTNVSITGNTANTTTPGDMSGRGGGIYNTGTLILQNVRMTGNNAGSDGGGIWNGGTMHLSNVTMTSNSASLDGGGIENAGSATIDGSTIGAYSVFNQSSSSFRHMLTQSSCPNNHATQNGGGIENTGNLDLTNSTVGGNCVNNYGGGIDMAGGSASLSGDVIDGNQAQLGGGGMEQSGGTAALTNDTIAQNSSVGHGGGLDGTGGNAALLNVTVAYNAGVGAAGIDGSAPGYTVTLKNTILAAQNPSGSNCAASGGSQILSHGYNLEDGSSCNLSATGDKSNTNAGLGSLGPNGGQTSTVPLLSTSAAIDSASPDCAPPGIDQRGVPRPQATACDIGAYESSFTSAGGSIAGTTYINDASHPLPNTPISLCTTTNICFRTTSDASGNFAISHLVPGTYVVTAYPPSYSHDTAATSPPIPVSDGSSSTQNLILTGPTPPPNGTRFDGSGARGDTPDGLPVIYWTEPSTLTTHGCAGGSATYKVVDNAGNVAGSGGAQGAMTETPANSGTYTASVPGTYPSHGPATVTITFTCPGTGQSTINFTIYIDPSGVVHLKDGSPARGVTVTLLQASSPSGPFTAVPNGDSVMSPANRTNSDTTDLQGRFGWDVQPGYYQIHADDGAGCSVDSAVLTIPPPATNLVLTLPCSHPTRAALSNVHMTRHGSDLVFHWRAAPRLHALGFDINAGAHQLNRVLIRMHGGGQYTYHVRWSGRGPYTLRTLLTDGTWSATPISG